MKIKTFDWFFMNTLKNFFIFGYVPSDSKNVYFYLLRCFCASISY